MVGEGAVVDEGGELGEVSLHCLIDGARQRLAVPLLAGEPGLGGVHVLQGGRAGEQIGLESGHLPRQGGRRVGQTAQALPLLLGAGAVHRRRTGEGGGVVAGLGQEGGGLLQLDVAIGQLAQGHLGRHGPPEDLGAQGAQHGGGGGVHPLLEIGIELAQVGRELGEGVEPAVGQVAPVGRRLHLALDRQTGRHREGGGQKAHPPHQLSGALSALFHMVSASFPH